MITFRAYRRRRLTPRPRFQVLLSVLLLFCARASAQLPPNVSTDTGVTLLTVLPGDPAYTMFGHTALRFVDPATGLDASFNYGTFDFDKTFVFRFASGKLDYRLDVVPTEPSFRHYRSENRTIIEQRLSLSAEETQELYSLLLTNLRPENRYYRYDFFLDNCSTRIRDILEAATGLVIPGSSATTAEPAVEGSSFRELLTPYIDRRPVLAALMNTGLGVGADAIATTRQTAFLPEELMAQVERTTRSGTGEPLVVGTDTLHVATSVGRSTMGIAATLTWALALLVGAVTGLRLWKRKTRLRWIDVCVFAGSGVVGLLLAYLWFGSEHVVTSNNLNLMWALPTHLVAAGYVAKRHLPTWTRFYFAIVLATTVILLCGLSWWTQQIHVVVVPIVVLIAFRAGRCLLSATNRPA